MFIHLQKYKCSIESLAVFIKGTKRFFIRDLVGNVRKCTVFFKKRVGNSFLLGRKRVFFLSFLKSFSLFYKFPPQQV